MFCLLLSCWFLLPCTGCYHSNAQPRETAEDEDVAEDVFQEESRQDPEISHDFSEEDIFICGDGMVSEGEECDDGNAIDGDGCDSDCTFSCTTDSECDDGRLCNGIEWCESAQYMCAPGEDMPAGSPCDDGRYCTRDDVCDGAGSCSGVGSDHLLGVLEMATGGAHTCALLETTGIVCWGYNNFGQLGNGSDVESSPVPVDVTGLSSGVEAISAGQWTACVIMAGGGVKCWGEVANGPLYDGLSNIQHVPVEISGFGGVPAAISCGDFHTCVLLDSGMISCWGHNDEGQLGVGTFEDSRVPVEVTGLARRAAAVSSGRHHTCALLDDGTVQCWGNNDDGELGNGTFAQSTVPVDVIGLSGRVLRIAAGGFHTCALLETGGLQCWGDSGHGQLGNGSTEPSPSAIFPLGMDEGIVAVDAGGAHTCVLLEGSMARCWGYNSEGQLGNGDFGWGNDIPEPGDVLGFPPGALDIACGDAHTCALFEGGTLMCWGANSSTQLGDGTRTMRTVPVDVVCR